MVAIISLYFVKWRKILIHSYNLIRYLLLHCWTWASSIYCIFWTISGHFWPTNTTLLRRVGKEFYFELFVSLLWFYLLNIPLDGSYNTHRLKWGGDTASSYSVTTWTQSLNIIDNCGDLSSVTRFINLIDIPHKPAVLFEFSNLNTLIVLCFLFLTHYF